MVIYKYPVSPAFDLALPENAQVLTVQMQHGSPQMWVMLDPNAPTQTRTFITIPTGAPFNATGHVYIDTFQVDWVVMHLFEVES